MNLSISSQSINDVINYVYQKTDIRLIELKNEYCENN